MTSALDLDAFRDPKLARELIARIEHIVGDRHINLMEVCGTHTMSIGRYGFRSMLPRNLQLLSGPGCPVCVTANHDIDHAIALARQDGLTVATFGDMMRVPGSSSSLAEEKSAGPDIRIVYSSLDAIELAVKHPEREIVFLGIGFETTAPLIAASILAAEERGLANFSVLCMHKTTPAALRAIASDPACAVDGFILPGHVSTITGAAPFRFLVDEFETPGVITGFEPVDILEGIALLVEMVTSGQPAIVNAYRRGVRDGGNPVASASASSSTRMPSGAGSAHFPALVCASAIRLRVSMPRAALRWRSNPRASRAGAVAATCCAALLHRPPARSSPARAHPSTR